MQKIKHIGIIVADADEFAPLADRITRGTYTEEFFLKRRILTFSLAGVRVSAMLCGIGKVNAAAAAAHLADIGCDCILNYGLSGGISGVRRGDICLSTAFTEYDFDLTTIGYKPCEKPGQESYTYGSDKRLCAIIRSVFPAILAGASVTGDRFVCDEALRTQLRDDFHAISCDMETAAIAYVCEYAGIPFAAIRRISDDAGEDAQTAYSAMNTSGETALSDLILDCAKAVATADL